MMFSGIALTNFELWQTPLGNIPSSSLYEKLDDKINFKLLNEAHAFEHSIEVQLPFLQTVLKDFRITPLLTGRVDRHKEIAVKLKEYINDNTLLIVSSDLSHYRPYKEAKRCDSETVKQILSLDANIDQEQACGDDGIKILIELAKMLKWKVKLLDYRNSGDTAGDKSQVVGYAAIVFYE
jgi:AmmeMemoRadiSam system protein B